MAADSEDILAVREWLSSEVKLERYADKLVTNGFISLKSCCKIDETVLDEVGIVLPYHRKRFLAFVEKLKEKLGAKLPNEANGVVSNTELIGQSEAGNEQQTSLICLKNDEGKSDLENSFSPPLLKEDGGNSESTVAEEGLPMLPPKTVKRSPSVKAPPPIPPRADLQEGSSSRDSNPRTVHVNTQSHHSAQPSHTEQLPVHGDVPKRKVPQKPPRRTVEKAASANKSEVVSGTSLESSLQTETQQQASCSVNNGVNEDIVATFDPLNCKELSTDVDNSLSAASELPHPQLSDGDLETCNDQTSRENYMLGEVDEGTGHTSLEAKRPAPKAAVRTGSKKPVPVPRAPRARVQSEDNVLVSAVAPERNNIDEKKEEIPSSPKHSLQTRTKSFTTPGNRNVGPTEDKPSTFPRYPSRPAPPAPPRQASLREKRSISDMPLPPIPTEGGNENQGDKLDGAVASGQVQRKHSADTSLAEQEPFADTTYEAINFKDYQKAEESGDDNYSSDDSLDAVEDLPDFGPKLVRRDSVDSLEDSRISRNILSPRVRKSEGYLWKQGGQQNNKGWRKRWFVFSGTDLRYYKDKQNLSESLHIIPVSQIRNIEPLKDAKRPTFKVITPNRNFILASESTTDMNLWSQTLMEAVIVYKGDEKAWKSGGDMCDPDKEGWLKKQGHNVVADWKKRYVAVKDDKICYYDTYEDFMYATPINCINAALAKVKTVEGHKNRFTIITFNKSYSFQGDSEFDAASWIIAIETAIQIGLGDRAILEKVWENPSNRRCADCGMKDPVWASINFCVCVCAKCVGIHRNLGVHCSRARSLLMDEKVWNPTLVELMIKIGNDTANQLLEHKLPEDDKISPDANVAERREFIYSKYCDKKYCKYHQAFGDNEFLGKCLRETVLTDDVVTTMELILNKVDVCFVPSDAEDGKTPLELAEEAGHSLQAELLRQNGGEGGQLIMQNNNDNQVTSESSPSTPFVEVVYEKEGFLYKKEGGWRKRWFLLKDRQLKYGRGPYEKEDLVTIDLTTVTSLVKCPKGEVLQMDIVTADKTHSLKADTEEELEAWYAALRSKQVFGVLLSQQQLGSDGIPHLVAKCLQFVETYGGIEMEGVYRVNGGQLTMKKLKTAFDQDARGVLLTLDDCGVHDVTGVLKQYLRQLPDPVIPGTMYKQFIAAGLTQDHSTRLITIKDLINQLPKVNHDTLKEIIFHLTKVVGFHALNKMGVPNIAMIFGPTLMSNENTGRMDDASINQEFSIVGDMINYYQWLFSVDNEEFEKDKAIQLAKQKIRLLNESRSEKSESTSGEFTLDIYVKEKNDDACRLKVSSEMTAGRVCAEVVAIKKLPPNIDWVLFEVIDNGAMERAFQVREKVLAAANWGSGNYLIVKENYIAEQINPHVGWLSIEGTLHMREPKKGWKQSHLSLKNGYLSVNKERGLIAKAIKSDKSEPEQWPLHKLTLYVGVPAEKATKGVDTSCGFTIVVKTDHEEITRYICVKDKRDLNRWLAAILNMKHPEGIWYDPSQKETIASSSSTGPQQTDDLPMFLGRQSAVLRRKGSSKHVMDELRTRQKSLRRSTARNPQT